MLTFILAFSLLASAPETVVESETSHLTEQEVFLEEMLDTLDGEEIVFDDLTVSLDEEDDLDLE